ncbi:MAG TPA: AAA family ATPase, partial [Leptospiraceae bacterium]|nr:AAA family ATPase [Leptospiraceae bacterium]
MKPLPIGIQTFRKIIDGNYLYIDKTRQIYQMIKNPSGAYFLSRPRRFGKSLTLSTLEEIFLGNRELFWGLWIYDSEYSWKKHPVIRFDFSKQKSNEPNILIGFINNQLDYIADAYSVQLTKKEYFERFQELIMKLGKTEKVVILIDEYDKPI